MSFTLPSFAKINLHLEILGKRDDGFHEISTIFQTVSLCDELTFEDLDSKVELVTDDSSMPTDDRNLIVRAVMELRSSHHVNCGARVILAKRIPIGGGLGGGSSNAAVTLIGLSKLWNLDVSTEELVTIAGQLGSDVLFFLYGGTAAASGRGEIIQNLPDYKADHVIIVSPDVHVSTRDAYSGLDSPNLTNTASNRILNVSRAAEILDGELKNDFEKTVFARFPEIGRTKKLLVELGAKHALMSGSGASVFGIFDNEETRQTALKALGEESDWRSFAVAAVSREEYREKVYDGLSARST